MARLAVALALCLLACGAHARKTTETEHLDDACLDGLSYILSNYSSPAVTTPECDAACFAECGGEAAMGGACRAVMRPAPEAAASCAQFTGPAWLPGCLQGARAAPLGTGEDWPAAAAKAHIWALPSPHPSRTQPILCCFVCLPRRAGGARHLPHHGGRLPPRHPARHVPQGGRAGGRAVPTCVHICVLLNQPPGRCRRPC